MAKKGYFSAKNVAWRELPSGYTQVEYIESSGSQYINTGVIGTSGLEAHIKVELTSNANSAILSSVASTIRIYLCQIDSGKWGYGYNNYVASTSSVQVGVIYEIYSKMYAGSQILRVNGEDVVTGSNGAAYNNNLNLALLALNANGSIIEYCKAKLYACKIYDNGTLVRDFVPCINANGVAGLYDTVSGVFFENAGTGSFLAGNQVHNDVAREPKKVYFSDNGVARKAKKAYFGDENGIARRWYASGITWAKYSCTRSGGTYYQQDYSNYGTQKTIGVSKGKTISSIGSNYTFSASTGFSLTDKWTCPYGIDEYWKIGGEVKGKYYLDNNTIWVIDGAYRDESYSGSEEYGLFIDCVGISKAVQRPYVYSKGSTLYGKITVDEGKLPESGTVIEGSVEKGYYVLKIGSTYYYYEIV